MAVKKLKESKYGVFRVGGSLGDNDPKGRVTKRIDGQLGILVKEFDDAESAKSYAAKRRKSLSPGERKYYGLSYKVSKLDESLKEGYSDGEVSISEIMDAISSLEELVEMMDDIGMSSIQVSASTYGLGQHFIGFPGGFINYNDVYSYVSEDEDEYYEESIKKMVKLIKENQDYNLKYNSGILRGIPYAYDPELHKKVSKVMSSELPHIDYEISELQNNRGVLVLSFDDMSSAKEANSILSDYFRTTGYWRGPKGRPSIHVRGDFDHAPSMI